MLPKILFVVDVRNWAYDNRAKAWKQLLSKEYDIDIIYLKDYPVHDPIRIFNHTNYNGILFFYHRSLSSGRMRKTRFPKQKVAVCINNEKWKIEGIEETFNSYLQPAKVVVACNRTIIHCFCKLHPCVLRASQVVDDKIFRVMRPTPIVHKDRKDFTVGWSGNDSNELKNVNIIRKACLMANVKLEIQTNLSLSELSKWYNTIDVVVCASSSEGGPSLILEAGACMVPVISTRVGLVPEIIKDQINGIIVKPNTHNICDAIIKLQNNKKFRFQLAKQLHKTITEKWTYNTRLYEIKNVLEKLIS